MIPSSRRRLAALGLALALALGALPAGACGGGDDGGEPAPAPGTDTTVTALDGTHVYFTGTDNQRVVDVPVTFPAAGLRYSQVTLRLGLRCPSPGGCDAWDRLGHLAILEPAAGGGDPTELELARFITPYKVGGAFTVDVTDLQRVLEGPQTVRVFIDTWVGPGSPYGAGWLVDAAFDFVGGLPAHDPVAVVPLWAPQRLVYGDPARPIDVAATVQVPAGVTSSRVRAFVTGHGQGNADNCAEFCSRDHTITVGATPTTATIWRDDCATTAVPGQQGTWQYARAGWCPGAMVTPWTIDAPAAAGPLTVRYGVEAYENTCRPDAPTCSGCTLGTSCPYDGGTHTEPGWEQSAVLVLYK
ncbi:MAG TPA: peptide-N-glycosidase F-related protein [Kofleriaceae bacterium]|nr:peptide-N-glycosidase F-related protein [Kofleriaceae bacterium]